MLRIFIGPSELAAIVTYVLLANFLSSRPGSVIPHNVKLMNTTQTDNGVFQTSPSLSISLSLSVYLSISPLCTLYSQVQLFAKTQIVWNLQHLAFFKAITYLIARSEAIIVNFLRLQACPFVKH